MRHQSVIAVAIGIAFVLPASMSIAQGQRQGQDRSLDRAQVERGQQDFDRDRLRDRDRIDEPSQDRDRDRDQDRTHVPDFAKLSDQDIYGSEVMTAQERNQYRKQLQDATNAEERNRVEAQHREMVQTRAKARNVDLAPPGQGIYGGALMSVEERSRYREQLRMIESDTEKAKFMAQHREEMQMRAQAQGVDPVELKETEEAE